MRDSHSGPKSPASVAASASIKPKDGVVFVKPTLTPKPSVPIATSNDANGASSKPSVYIFNHLFNKDIDREIV
jgi:hypothetical protein